VSDALLEVVGLSKGFPLRGGLFGGIVGEVKAVSDVSFALAKGEAFGLAGESGSGKSTIARMIVGLAAPSAGAILFEGRDLARQPAGAGAAEGRLAAHGARDGRPPVQMVFQNPGSSLNPRRSIGQSIAVPLEARGVARAEIDQRVARLLDMVQLPVDFATRYPHELSGGQKQRVAIARAIAAEPKLIVLDEPTSALDVSVQAKIIDLLNDLGRSLGLTYLFISHDLSLMRNFVSRVGILYLGRLVEVGPVRTLFESPAHPYTRSLIAAVPVVSDEEAALKPNEPVVEGEIPSPANQPAGCAFHTRCPHAFGPCETQFPDAVRLDAGHFARCHLLAPANSKRVGADRQTAKQGSEQ
jgi:peptide/nickel transport system ATP-binding protein